MDVVEFDTEEQFFVAGEDAFKQDLALQLLAYFEEVV